MRVLPLLAATVVLTASAASAGSAAAPPAAPKSYLLRPARLRRRHRQAPHGLGGARHGRAHRRRRPGGAGEVPRGHRGGGPGRHHAAAGLIEGHSHLRLHPYNEARWNDQVLKESLAPRVVRATNHARATLLAGFTTARDLGTEGAADADVGLKQAIDQGIIPGPRLLVTTRAIVATGSYGPKGFAVRSTAITAGAPMARRAPPSRSRR